MRKFFNVLILGFLIISPLALAGSARAANLAFSTIQVTDDENYNLTPITDGNYIIWEKETGGGSQIYSYNIAAQETSLLVDAPLMGINIYAINGNQFIYSVVSDYYIYNLETDTISELSVLANAYNMDISGNYIVYNKWAGGHADVYLYNIVTEESEMISDGANFAFWPRIDGNKVVWADSRNGNSDIYIYDITSETETQITDDEFYQSYAAIDNNKIVYVDADRNGNDDIYMYDLVSETETQVTTNSLSQYAPDISGNYIIWWDLRDDTEEDWSNISIYLYDISTGQEYQVATGIDASDDDPYVKIGGNAIVWNTWPSDDYYQIFMATISAPQNVGSRGSSGPVFVNLPGANSPINITEGQTITVNPFTIRVYPTSSKGIQKVEFYIDDVLICTATQPNSEGVYSCDWDTSKYHSLVKIIAYDTNGRTATLTRNTSVSLITELPQTGADLE